MRILFELTEHGRVKGHLCEVESDAVPRVGESVAIPGYSGTYRVTRVGWWIWGNNTVQLNVEPEGA
jgi:hypothetical protein